MKKAVFIILLLLFHCGAKAQATAASQHPHSFYEEIFGSPEDSFVCYPRVHRNFYMAILAGAILATALLINRYRLKKRSNVMLEEKNRIIGEKNKDITDSIRYAERIQHVILPSNELVKEVFKNNFVFFQPKDIVSGDFYWAHRLGNNSMIAAVDCTGHGVPGALLSIIAHGALNKMVEENKLVSPSEILLGMHQQVRKTLQQDKESEVRDGMDIALCSFDHITKKLYYSGANNPLYVIQKVQDKETAVLQEFKGEKQAIGHTGDEFSVFTQHQINLQNGDMFYIFSDGYADQFGGQNRKKFLSRNMKELLLRIHAHPLNEQKQILEETFFSWKSELEQVDDVVVIGVRIE